MGRPTNAPSSCIACAKAKRRCSKQKPTCVECWSRGVQCHWPQAKPSSFVLLEEEDAMTSLPSSNQVSKLDYPSFEVVGTPDLFADLSFTGLGTTDQTKQLTPWWFTSPETWMIDHAPDSITQRHRSPEDLSRAMATIFQWLGQWVDGDSNPFIHHRLYHHRFPQHLQNAYMALSCYLRRKKTNEQVVLGIVRDKALSLINENRSPSVPSAIASTTTTGTDLLEQLARVQALLIYQLIGLYDGDIRLRAIAERQIPIMIDTMHQVVDNASRSDCLGASLLPRQTTSEPAANTTWEELAWYSWIMAESLRRTWLVGSAVQGVYLSSRDGVARCLGGMMFTSRSGFWTAATAREWRLRCCDTYGGLVRLSETHKLFTAILPCDLDEFAKLILEVTFGREQMDGWGVESAVVAQ